MTIRGEWEGKRCNCSKFGSTEGRTGVQEAAPALALRLTSMFLHTDRCFWNSCQGYQPWHISCSTSFPCTKKCCSGSFSHLSRWPTERAVLSHPTILPPVRGEVFTTQMHVVFSMKKRDTPSCTVPSHMKTQWYTWEVLLERSHGSTHAWPSGSGKEETLAYMHGWGWMGPLTHWPLDCWG
jgi:hypothetical protein